MNDNPENIQRRLQILCRNIKARMKGSQSYEDIIRHVQEELETIAYKAPRTKTDPNFDAVPHPEQMKYIMLMVARYYGMSYHEISSRTQTSRIAKARHVAIYLQYEWLTASWTDLGIFWGKDHSTATNSHTRAKAMLEDSMVLQGQVVLWEAEFRDVAKFKEVA